MDPDSFITYAPTPKTVPPWTEFKKKELIDVDPTPTALKLIGFNPIVSGIIAWYKLNGIPLFELNNENKNTDRGE